VLRPSVFRKREFGSVSRIRVFAVPTNEMETIKVENVDHPGRVTRPDASMYEAMKQTFLKILPKTSPGLTEAEIRESVLALFSLGLALSEKQIPPVVENAKNQKNGRSC
jgi:hypothetical protein